MATPRRIRNAPGLVVQSVDPGPLAITVRPPWNDELLRLREFMPTAFRLARPDSLLVAVQGPLERIIGAAAVIPPIPPGAAATLRWRIAGERYHTREILKELFA